MSPTAPSFTPAQILQAGRQAEADGRTEYAVQFYRHLTDHYAQTLEAAEARSALQRMAGRTAPARNGPIDLAPPVAERPAPSFSLPRPSPMPPPASPQHQVPASIPVSTPLQPQAAPARIVLPPRPRGYLIGRLLSTLFSILGWLLIGVGIALIGLGLGTGFDPGRLVGVSTLVIGPAVIVAGIAIVFWGELARAIFDTANASRDLAAIERAKVEK